MSKMVMARITPKFVYLIVLLAGLGLAAGDHLTSRSMAGLGAPSDLGNACAPCGAPCTE
ncbi:MAG: hypothetical protein L7W94_08365 [Alphaproteobacteria bacterium]|nr:hypothetical protein [Alphaproteobacteria bacterium]